MSATDVLHQHRRPIEKAARAGYVARGAVYLIRPDTYVALADQTGAPLAIADYLAARGLAL